MKVNKLIALIKQYNNIYIYHHVNPDHDALGSSFGLRQFIIDNFPHKNVFVMGDNNYRIMTKYELQSSADENLLSGLAIILDTANHQRIDDQSYAQASYRLKIDHHLNIDSYADEEIVDEKASSTCEILGSIFKEENYKLSSQCAKYLYQGLISDNINYTTSNTTTNSLLIGAYLAQFVTSIQECSQFVFEKSMRTTRFENYVRSKIEYNQKLAYTIVKKEEYEKYDISVDVAKSVVYLMANVRETNIWVLFTQISENNYDASMRSKKIPIQPIAKAYGGGGHLVACGVKNLTLEKVQQLIKELTLLAND